MARKLVRAALAALLLVSVIASPALAARGGQGKAVRAAAAEPAIAVPAVVEFGARYTATVTTEGDFVGFWVNARCFRDGGPFESGIVYSQWAAVADGRATLTAGPTPSWFGGSAACVVDLVGFLDYRALAEDEPSRRAIASATFEVSG